MTDDALAALIVNKLRGTLKVVAVKMPGFGDRRRALLEDAAIRVGGRVISETVDIQLKRASPEDLGTCRTVWCDKDATTLIGGAGSRAAIPARSNQIRIETAASYDDRKQLQGRLAKLIGKMAVIHVGAAAETERKEKRACMKDALDAARASVEKASSPAAAWL